MTDLWCGREELGVQVRAFEDLHLSDLEETFGPDHHNRANHYHLFNELFTMVGSSTTISSVKLFTMVDGGTTTSS